MISNGTASVSFYLSMILSLTGLAFAESRTPPRTESADYGDHYQTSRGQRSLHRLKGAVAVHVSDSVDPAATIAGLTSLAGLFENYQPDMSGSSGIIPILNEISVSRCDDLEVLGQ